MYKRLKKYKAEYGDTLAPWNYADRKLYEWVNKQ